MTRLESWLNDHPVADLSASSLGLALTAAGVPVLMAFLAYLGEWRGG